MKLGICAYTLIYTARTVFLLSYPSLKAIWTQLIIQKLPCLTGVMLFQNGVAIIGQ